MKNIAAKYILSIALHMIVTAVYAYDFKVGGIYYTITSSSEHTCMVTYGSSPTNTYSGDVKIPTSITYNSQVYKVTGIDEYAFFKCDNLKYVEIPSSVNTINRCAFYACPLLSTVVNLATSPQEIIGNTFYSTNATVHVPNGYENNYKAAANWSNMSIVGDMINYQIGDVDNNGMVNANDVKFLGDYLTSKRTALFNSFAPDVNNDKKIDILDLAYLIALLNGKYKPAGTNISEGSGTSVIPSWGRPGKDPGTPSEGEIEF